MATYEAVSVVGGPVGLLTAYKLRRFGVSACVLKQFEGQTQDAYGRGIALFPRTTEQIDQPDLIEPMLQLGFACRSRVTYRDGVRVVGGSVPSKFWTLKLESVRASCYQEMRCVDFQVGESAPLDSYAVTSTFTNHRINATFKLKSKYLVGSRIDGIVDTDTPLNRSYGAIGSKTHGNVLGAIAARDSEGVTLDVAEKEAVESPLFNVKFKEIQWWTHYTVGQRITKTFSTNNGSFSEETPFIHTEVVPLEAFIEACTTLSILGRS